MANQMMQKPAVLAKDSEMTANAMWRFLHLRDYLNDEHRLAPWGVVLDAALGALPAAESGTEEAVLLAIELLRLDLLNSRPMFPTYSGMPAHGSGLYHECIPLHCLRVLTII